MRVAGVAAISAALALASAGCRSAGRGLADDDPAYKVPAIKKAVGHAAAAPDLVAGLDDDDPAVRFYASEALRRMSGQTFDYRYYDNAPARQPAIARWRQWLSSRPPGPAPAGGTP